MPAQASAPPLPEVLAAAVAAAEREGEHLLAEFCLPQGPRGSGSKAPIDDEIEARLRAALQRALDCDFVGEETGLTPGRIHGWCWLVDPHDATSNFLKGERGSAISIGLLRDRVPVLGVVHVPASPDHVRDTIAWAEGAGPLLRNGRPQPVDLSRRALAPGEFVFATAGAALRPQIFSRSVAPSRYVALASVAHRMARVAAGDGVATLSIHPVSEHDIAAGAALLRGAGGVVLDFDGREVVFTGKPAARVNGCIAGAPLAAARLARIDWSAVKNEARRPVRISTAFPKVCDAGRLARAQGCLLGQAIGDSLGSLVEFMDATAIARAYPGGVRELADGGTFDTIAGQPTDDTEMALALARSIVAGGGFSAEAALRAYRDWLATDPIDIGGTTRRGLAGDPDSASEANGSLMRISPIGVAAAGDPARAAREAREDSRLTHPAPACVEACAGFAAAVAAGISTGSREAMAEAALAHSNGAAREAIRRGLSGDAVDDFITRQGWVLIALQNAFFQLLHCADFESALVATLGEGGDTDTNAAIAGALAGAACGIAVIPPRWVLPVLACRPLAEAHAPRPRPMHYWPDDILQLAEALLSIRNARQ